MNGLQHFIITTAVLTVSLASSFTTQLNLISHSVAVSPISFIQSSRPPFHTSLSTRTAQSPSPFSQLFRESSLAASDDDNDEDDDWEYEDYEDLTESDFYNTEWKIGTVMDGGNPKIIETWARLLLEEIEEGFGGSQIQRCIWGDGAKGKWKFDRASQFLSMTKESFGGLTGKKIWAGSVDDYYFLQGSVRGWSPISSAGVLGQWQAIRLGVDKEERGVAPWFEKEEEDEEESEIAGEEKEEETPQLAGNDATEDEVESSQILDSTQDEVEVEEETEAKVEEETEAKAEEETEAKAEEETEAKAEEETEAKAEEETEAKVEEETETKVEEETEDKVKEETEAKAEDETEANVEEETEGQVEKEIETPKSIDELKEKLKQVETAEAPWFEN